MTKIQAIRGMNDILPAQTPFWQYLENRFQYVVHRYGYREIRFPILEHTQLFKRSIGEVTDIVEKEMYSFDDRNGDNLSLRPEGTAGCVRAAEEHGLLYNQQQRLWYQGPMFRHERPQKGRYRQFDQFGVEAFGMAGPDIDAEVILLSARLWQELGISSHLRLEINNIGSAEDRSRYGAALTAFLQARVAELDEDSRRRLASNPLRILDSKHPGTREVLKMAPVLADFVNPESQAHYRELKSLLTASGIIFRENNQLVRGLDYYNNTVFEWITDALGAQGTVCAGGRYDSLVAQLGGKSTPAVGFASGKERLVLLLDELGTMPAAQQFSMDVYIAVLDDSLVAEGVRLAESLRSRLPQLKLQLNCGGGKYSSQMKKAFACNARLAVILEFAGAGSTAATIKLRPMVEGAEQSVVSADSLADEIQRFLTA